MLDTYNPMSNPMYNLGYNLRSNLNSNNNNDNNNMLDLQVEHENYMLDQAKQRLDKDNTNTSKRREWSTSKLGRAYVKQASNSFYPAVQQFMDLSMVKGTVSPGKHRVGAKKLAMTGIEPEVVSYLTSKAIFNFLALFSNARTRMKKVSMAIRIADLIHDEWRIRVFSNTDKRKALIKKLAKDFDKRTYPREWRKRTITNYFHAEQVDWEGWNRREKVHVGYSLLCLFAEHTKLVMLDNTYVDATDALVQHIQDNAKRAITDFTLYRPMLIPPRPWDVDSNLFRGGYLTRSIKPYSCVKRTRKRDVLRMVDADWSEVLPAVNALQDTPWRINKTMLEAVNWSYHSHGGGIGKLAKSDDEKLPLLPANYETDEQVKKEHNKVVFEIHDRNRQEKSKRISALMTLRMGHEYANTDNIYFPHNLDSRGRAYPVSAFLNPQGADYVKSLLEFAHGEPVENEDHANWLAISGANAYGEDKIDLEDRVKWVHNNEDMILSIADGYASDHTWMHTSEPMQFLRFCQEWAEFRRNGYGFVSHMVVPVDATCSGLQHYSAMLRDEIGGRSVNLIPDLPRQDVYGDVAAVVARQLLDDASPTALDWLAFGIDRKITKRQVMVVPYAGKFSSCLSYTREAVAEKIYNGAIPGWNYRNSEEHTKHITMLAQNIWQAIGVVVVKAREAMVWLSAVARAFSKHENKTDKPVYDRRMTWVTPDGFEVVHFQEATSLNRVNTYLDGRVRLSIYEENGNLDPRDMALAVAPNFVHSMDACHMRMTIRRAQAIGIKHFGMVHDSFGVHASRMGQFLHQCVKPAFVDMYQQDVLGEFYERYKWLGIDPPPSKGELDLAGVLRSQFFFS